MNWVAKSISLQLNRYSTHYSHPLRLANQFVGDLRRRVKISDLTPSFSLSLCPQLGEDQIYRTLRDDSPPSDVSSTGPLMAAATAAQVGATLIPGSAEKKKRVADRFTLRSSNSSASDLAEVIRMARTKKNSLSGQSGGCGPATPSSAITPSDSSSQATNGHGQG